MIKNTVINFRAIDAGLSSDDESVRIQSAVNVWVKTQEPAVAKYLKARAVRAIDESSISRREYVRLVTEQGGSVTNTNLGQHGQAWDLIESVGIAHTVDNVSVAVTVYGNVRKDDIAAWVDDIMALDVPSRDAFIVGTDYKSLKSKPVKVEAEVSEETDESIVTDAEVKGSGFDGLLAVIAAAAGRVNSGAFTAAEAVQLAHAARGIITAAEAFTAAELVAA